MVAVCVAHDDKVLEQFKSFGALEEARHLEVYDTFDESQRTRLYETCRRVRALPRRAISVFRGSLIEGQLPVLENYEMDVEVCKVVYSRLHSDWTDRTRIEGSLT